MGQSGQGWRPVPLRGRITVDRRIDSNTSFNGVELIKRERASMTITVDDTVRVERAGTERLYTEGSVTTSVNGREIWDFGEESRFTHTYDFSGREPFGPDPESGYIWARPLKTMASPPWRRADPQKPFRQISSQKLP